MSRGLQTVLFVATALAITFGLHFYLWMRLVRDPHLPPPWRYVVTGVLVLCGLSIPAAFFAARTLSQETAKIVTFPMWMWMGIMFLLFSILLGMDVVKLAIYLWHKGRGVPVDPERRVFLARVASSAAATATLGLTALAVREALGKLHVNEVRIALPRWPRALHGTTIVQLSDMHVGPTLGREFVEEVVRRVNALEPDVVAITGDLVDGSPRQLRDQVAPLAELEARWGVYFVTGNHEYYSGVEGWLRTLGEMGIRCLRNEHVVLGNGEGRFCLAGVDDHTANRFGDGHGPFVDRAVAGRDPELPVVLLAHQPRTALLAKEHGVDLQLSGHTHAGQIWPFKYLVYLVQPVVEGLGKVGETLVYVNRGTGFWGPPMRLAAPAEITKVVLESPEWPQEALDKPRLVES